ncbi:unnamed protein product [Ambrosiozyma monospora]|uniref:Unnamed protein product n=1 Tax=Ambrosiozyma monospora TaxID=43982 RepID=A0ACB5UBF0_AMBMO|nr:unnamed protein product [Ambrosiozyma monospora]
MTGLEHLHQHHHSQASSVSQNSQIQQLQHLHIQQSMSPQSHSQSQAYSQSQSQPQTPHQNQQHRDQLTSLNSISSSNVKIGIKPLPLTSALVKSDYNLVENLTNLGYDKVILPITNNRYKENCKSSFKKFKDSQSHNLSELNVPHPSLTEVNILTGSHIQNTVGLLSSWIELDSDDVLINEFSLQVLNNEVSYAKFVGLSTLLIAPPIDLTHLPIFTSNLNTILNRYPSITISISLPICEEVQVNSKGESIPIIDHLSTWDMWNTIRIQCNYSSNLTNLFNFT